MLLKKIYFSYMNLQSTSYLVLAWSNRT